MLFALQADAQFAAVVWPAYQPWAQPAPAAAGGAGNRNWRRLFDYINNIDKGAGQKGREQRVGRLIDNMLQSVPSQLNQSFMTVSPATLHTNSNPSASASTSPELLLLHNEKYLTHFAQLLNMSNAKLSNLLSQNVSSNGSIMTTMTTSLDNGLSLAEPGSEADESSTLLIVLTVCYALIFVAGVLGNLITCIVIARNNFMHTATNFYLFNLAVSDLILLVSGKS